MKALVVSIALLFVAGCASQPVSTGGSVRNETSQSATSTGGSVRYECYTYVGSKHALTLPVAPLNSEVGMVTVTFHGDRLEAHPN